ncbi:MAG: elongation factor P [Verrucomicrobia bacterium]|jgi:elongation factor P|nr:elongation factor P [Verrucomicrobiota bacterium]
MASPTEIRKGKVIDYNGAPHIVLEMLHRTQGRQAGFVQVTLRNLHTGSSTTTKLRSTDSVEILMTDTKRMELSYRDQEGWHFLDTETFEDVVLSDSMVQDALDFLAEGNEADILFVDGEPVQVQLPASVELEVTEAPDAIKGDTSGAAMKPVTVATGLVIQTPLFIKTGDIIKVSTADKSYLGRA